MFIVYTAMFNKIILNLNKNSIKLNKIAIEQHKKKKFEILTVYILYNVKI